MKKIVLLIAMLAIAVSMTACAGEKKQSALVGESTKSTGVIGGADEATDIKVTDEKEDKSEDKKDKKSDKKETKKEEKADTKKSEDKKAEQKTESKETTEVAESEPEVKVTPTFMFFVTKKDSDYNKAMQAVEDLKKSYGEKIRFDIVDIDEKPEAKENFSLVVGNTPALIMLDTSNNISDIKMKLSDKAEMESAIENALQ